jgi:hypothetical protein
MPVGRLSALSLASVFAAALVAPAGAQSVELKPTAKIKRDKYVITAEEIAEHPELTDGYDAVRLLRNQWLRPSRTSGSALSSFGSGGDRPPPGGCRPNSTDAYCTKSAGEGGGRAMPSERGTPYADTDGGGATAAQFLPVLYIDDIKREGVNDLRALRPADIFEMRFLTGNQASGRYGSGHENGAILVKTVRFGKG